MKIGLRKYYFTFGTSGKYPYKGGWVTVYAVDIHHAIQLFREKYADRDNYGAINCADYYSEKEFTMKETGNFGAYCHDVIMPEGAELDDYKDETRNYYGCDFGKLMGFNGCGNCPIDCDTRDRFITEDNKNCEHNFMPEGAELDD